MTTLGSRVKAVIVHNKTTMSSFAKDLNISPSMVSKICSGKSVPSDRTISDICRIYSINRDWLINGTGDMIDPQEKEAEYYVYMESTGRNASDDLKKEFARTLARTSPLELEALRDLYSKMLAAITSKSDLSKALEMAYLEGFRAGQKVTEMINNLPTDTDNEE